MFDAIVKDLEAALGRLVDRARSELVPEVGGMLQGFHAGLGEQLGAFKEDLLRALQERSFHANAAMAMQALLMHADHGFSFDAEDLARKAFDVARAMAKEADRD